MSIEKQLKMGNLNSALDLLMEETTPVDHLHSDAILLQASWKSTETDYKKGLLTRKEYDLAFNRTVEGIQHVMRAEPALFAREQVFDSEPGSGNLSRGTTRGYKRWIWLLLSAAVLLVLVLTSREYWPASSKKEAPAHAITSNPTFNASESTTPKRATDKADEAVASRPAKSMTGVILYDGSGDVNNELSEKLAGFLKQTGFKVIVCEQTNLADFERRFEARITDQKEEVIFFNKKVIRHHIRLNLSLLQAKRNVCPSVAVSTLVEAGQEEDTNKIMEQALSSLFDKIKNQKLLDNCR